MIEKDSPGNASACATCSLRMTIQNGKDFERICIAHRFDQKQRIKNGKQTVGEVMIQNSPPPSGCPYYK